MAAVVAGAAEGVGGVVAGVRGRLGRGEGRGGFAVGGDWVAREGRGLLARGEVVDLGNVGEGFE